MDLDGPPEIKDWTTGDDPSVELCGLDGHDWRLHEYVPRPPNPNEFWWRCVWCHAVACDNPGTENPCMEPYHHKTPHRTAKGVTWPLGGSRP